MPRGVPKAGFRKRTRNVIDQIVEVEHIFETDDQIDARIRERFEILEDLTNATVSGISRALIVSGPPGLGKSFTVERVVSKLDPADYTIIKGFVRATGLYRTLYEFREPGQVIVFDDADSIFMDDSALALLKASCDTTEDRKISWRAETTMRQDDGDALPTQFEFNGSIIFITNRNFDRIVEMEGKFHEDISAMISRAHYVDLSINTRRDYLVRIKQVVGDGMLSNFLSANQIKQVVDYIETNLDSLRELSLRMAIKIGSTIKSNPTKWQRICDVTCRRI